MASATSAAPPALPSKPGDMSSVAVVNNNGKTDGNGAEASSSQVNSYNNYGQPSTAMSSAGMYGSPYSGYSGYSGYGGGAYGGTGYGGYGAYGSGFGGGYGMGLPYSRFGGSGYGMSGYNLGGTYSGDPNAPPPPSLTNQIHAQTAPAFHLIESLVSAFSSLAQLFESTYMATHSSFFAMIGVADQLGGIKTYLAQVLGAFSLLRLGRKIIAWLRGERSNTQAINWADEWRIGQAVAGPGGLPSGSVPIPDKRPSVKPLVVFLLSAVGLPYLMTKLVRLLTRLQEQQQRELQSKMSGGAPAPGGQPGQRTPITFARAIFPFESSEPHELSLKRDEIVAILQRYESDGREMGWWRGRTRDGRSGWFPGNYVEILRRREETLPATPESTAKTVTPKLDPLSA